MTPEERFERIEKNLAETTERMKLHDAEIQELIVASRTQKETIQKHNEAIQALIVVSRTLLTSIQESRVTQERAFAELREMGKATEEKLNILIDTVDRIIRSRGPNGQQG
jgi:hypothetical protein